MRRQSSASQRERAAQARKLDREVLGILRETGNILQNAKPSSRLGMLLRKVARMVDTRVELAAVQRRRQPAAA